MKRLIIYCTISIFIALIWVSSCTHPSKIITTPSNNGYPESIASILVSKCTYSGCHNQASYQNAGLLLLDSWAHLFQGGISGAVVVAYNTTYSPLLAYCNPDSTSLIYVKDAGHFGSHPAPTTAEYNTLYNWIAKGAPDNSGNIPFAANAATRQKMYITVSGCNLVAVVDGQSKLVMRYIPVGTYPGNNSMHDIVVSSDGNYGYIAFYLGQLLQKFDTRTDTIVGYTDLSGTVPGGQGQWGILQLSPSDTAIMVSGYQSAGSLVTINTSTMKINNKMTIDPNNNGSSGLIYPHGIANNATFDTFFVTLQYGNVVDKISFTGGFSPKYLSINNNAPVAASTASTPDPHQIQMTPDNSRYFVSCQNSNEVRVMDAHADTLIKAIPVGPFPQEMAIYPSKNYLFVACLLDSVNRTLPPSYGNIGTVFVIDYNTYQVVATLKGDFNTPHDVAVDSIDGLIYIVSENNYTGGIPAHHVTACGGNAGWYTVYNLNTLQPADNIRYELAKFPYAISNRF